MPMTSITANGTYQLKDKAGYIVSISVPNAGTSWTLQIFDGPDQLGNSKTVYGGGTAGAITTGLTLLAPLYCSTGIKVVFAGTAGEMDIQWY